MYMAGGTDQVIAELRTGQGKWSRPKLSKIENREQGVKPREVEQLLDVYNVTDLPEPIPDIGYAEGPARPVYFDNRDDVRKYTLRFGILIEQALSQAMSVKLIVDAAKSYQ